MVSIPMSRPPLRQAYGPESLSLLMTVYDECLRELMTWYSAGEPSDLNGMERVLAERIMGAASRGVVDPGEIRRSALTGFLPERVLSAKREARFSAAS
jgi:hypothetical protein